MLVKIRIDGVEYEVTEQVAQALEKERAAALATTTEATARADRAEAQLDAAKEQLATEQAARKDAEDPARIAAAVAARVALETAARKVLGEDARFDAMSDRDVKLAALAKSAPAAKFDAKSDEYVQARFDAALEAVEAAPSAIEQARTVVEGRTDAGEPASTEAAARARMLEASRNAWKSGK